MYSLRDALLGIIVFGFIILEWMFVLINTTTMISFQPHLLEGNEVVSKDFQDQTQIWCTIITAISCVSRFVLVLV